MFGVSGLELMFSLDFGVQLKGCLGFRDSKLMPTPP